MLDLGDSDDDTHALVMKAKDGDTAALVVLLERMRGMVASLVRQARVHVNDRDDCCQEGCLVVMRCVGGFDPAMGSFRGYAFASLRKMIRQFQRATGRQILTPLPDDLTWEPTQAELSAAELLMKAKYPDVVKAFFGVGRPERNLNQIATELQCSPATVKAMLMESLQAMRQEG